MSIQNKKNINKNINKNKDSNNKINKNKKNNKNFSNNTDKSEKNNNLFNLDISNFIELNNDKTKITENESNTKNKNDKNKDIKKNEVLKLLKNIGIDTRFISYTEDTIYINDQRFSKFSKKRQETFKKSYPKMNIISSGIFQKICIRASKVLSEKLSPREKILLLKSENANDDLIKIVLEPYSRKYGVTIIESHIESKDIDSYLNNVNLDIIKDINFIAKSMTLDEKVEDILSNIFSGNGIINNNTQEQDEFEVINPFINTPNNWIDSFNNYIQESYKNNNNFLNNKDHNNKYNNKYNHNNKHKNGIINKNKTDIIIADSFMEFLDNIIPQYKENLFRSAIFIENKLNKHKL